LGWCRREQTDDCTCISATEIADGANKAIAQHNANLTAGAGSNGDWNRGGGSFGPNLEWTRYKLSDGTYTKPMLTGTGGGDVWDRMTTIDLTLGGPRVDGVQVGFWIPVTNQLGIFGQDSEVGYGYRIHKKLYLEDSPALADFDMTNFIPSKGILKGSMALGGLLVRGGRGIPGRGLGNPFKNATLGQVDGAFQSHVQSGKLQLKYTNPITGGKAYQNTKSGHSYYLDPGGVYGRKFEPPHIDVNYPNPKPLNRPSKKKLPVAGGF
jgi:hypothetical protein